MVSFVFALRLNLLILFGEILKTAVTTSAQSIKDKKSSLHSFQDLLWDNSFISVSDLWRSLTISNRVRICRDPSDQELQIMLLSAYEKYIKEINYGMEYFYEQVKHREHIYNTSAYVYKSTYEEGFGSRDCTRSTQTVWWSEGGPTTCPYHFEDKHRTGWYPRILREAECNCPDSCLSRRHGKPQIFTCMSNYNVKPVLKKGICQDNDVFAYEPVLEYVRVSCSCREINRIIFTT